MIVCYINMIVCYNDMIVCYNDMAQYKTNVYSMHLFFSTLQNASTKDSTHKHKSTSKYKENGVMC